MFPFESVKSNPVFKFEPKLGWPEFISFVALMVSGFSLYQSYLANSPSVLVKDLPITTGSGYFQQWERSALVVVIPILVVNKGGRTTSLLALRAHETLSPVILLSNGKPLPQGTVNYYLFSHQGPVNDLWEQDLEALLTKWRHLDLSRKPILNISLPSGHNEILNIGIIADVYDGRQRRAENLLFGVDAEFSHGEKTPIRIALEIPAIRGGRR